MRLANAWLSSSRRFLRVGTITSPQALSWGKADWGVAVKAMIDFEKSSSVRFERICLLSDCRARESGGKRGEIEKSVCVEYILPRLKSGSYEIDMQRRG